MINISLRTKSSIKLALSLVIAYGISLSLNWKNPYWAAFAIVFTSLSSIGQSLSKAALRILGTVVAAVVAITIMAMFPQSRWLFLLALSLYTLFCAYMMTGKSHQYFYQVAGFVTLIICLKGGINTSYTFEIAILRVQQTVMGVVVSTLVGLLIWPEGSFDNLISLGTRLFSNYSELFSGYQKTLNGVEDLQRLRELRLSINKTFLEYSSAMAASAIDTFEISLSRERWRFFEGEIKKLADEFELWRECVVELEHIDYEKAFHNISAVNAEITGRLDYLSQRFYTTKKRWNLPLTTLKFDLKEMHNYSYSECATLEIAKKRVDEINRITYSLVQCIDNSEDISFSETPKSKKRYPNLDIDRLIPAVRVVATFWVAVTLWINIRIPGETGYIVMGTSLGMAFLTSPKIPVANIIKPAAISCFVASLVFVFIIPQLSSFYSLGPFIFGVSFLVSYVFGKPTQALSKAFGLAMILSIASISNPQQHNFLVVATMVTMFGMILLLLVIMSHVPTSIYPGNVTLSLIQRFWKCAGGLVAKRVEIKNAGILESWSRSIMVENLVELPEKTKTWIPFIDNKRFSGISKKELYDLDEIIRTVSKQLIQIFAVRERSKENIAVKSFDRYFEEWDELLSKAFFDLQNYNSVVGQVLGESEFVELLELLNSSISNKIASDLNNIEGGRCALRQVFLMFGYYNCISSCVLRYKEIVSRNELDVLGEFRL